MLFFSFFRTLASKNVQVTVELKNDVQIAGTLHFVDQFLNLKLSNITVNDSERCPHLLSVKSCFLRGSIIRYIHFNTADVDTELLQDFCRKESQQQEQSGQSKKQNIPVIYLNGARMVRIEIDKLESKQFIAYKLLDTDLLGYISDTYVGEDVEEILEKNKELEARCISTIPPVSESIKQILDVIAITNLPNPSVDKIDKLYNAVNLRLRDIFINYNLHEDPMSIIDLELVHGENECYGFDKKYKLSATQLEYVNNYLNLPAKKSVHEDVSFIKRANLRQWLTDPLGREQFAYRSGFNTEVKWFDAITKTPASDFTPQDVSLFFLYKTQTLGFAFCWSPMGTYFLTFHKRGVWIRANEKFDKQMCFDHIGVKHVLFSPNEEYLITYNGQPSQASWTIDHPPVILWEIATGRKLFISNVPMFSPSGEATDAEGIWPYFQFSHDSLYLAARMDSTGLTIFDLQAVKKSLFKINRALDFVYTKLSYQLHQFQWSPTENILSIWIPEVGETPSRCVLTRIDTGITKGDPSYQELTSRNLFFVKTVKMHWRECGQFLALDTTFLRKLGKKSRKVVHQIEIFRVKEKSIPVDTILLENFNVLDFAWENTSTNVRFAVIVSCYIERSTLIQFYRVPPMSTKEDTQIISTLSVAPLINSFAWSPAGQYFVAFQSGTGTGHITFGCLNEQNKSEIIQKDEQSELNTAIWDPSGRCVAVGFFMLGNDESCRYKTNVGFRIYSFLGRLMYRFQDSFCNQFLWRPRPPLIIPPKKVDDIHKRLKEYSKKFDAQDDKRRQERQLALKEQKLSNINYYNECLKKAAEYIRIHPLNKLWISARENLNKRLDYVNEVITYEEVIDVTRELIE